MNNKSLIRRILTGIYWVICIGMIILTILQVTLLFHDDGLIPLGAQIITIFLFCIVTLAFFIKAKNWWPGTFRAAIGVILLVLSGTPFWFDFAHFNLQNPDPLGSKIVTLILVILGMLSLTWSYYANKSSNK